MEKWKTVFPGVRAKTHPTRKHGKRLDQYFSIRYQRDKKTVVEGLGWASDGWSASKAVDILAGLKESIRTGKGPQSLADAREQTQAERARGERESLTFEDFFDKTYEPLSKANKSHKSYLTERSLYKGWVKPVVGDKPLLNVSPLHLERIKRNMADAGRSPRSIHYCLAMVRQIFNLARTLNLYEGQNPVDRVKKPRSDNRRVRFLSHSEADKLLKELESNPQLHDIALMGLHCGMRAGEIFNLSWDCIDLERKSILLKDTKSGKNRTVFMTQPVKDMLTRRDGAGSKRGYIFLSRKGDKIAEVSNAFAQVVDKLGFNEGVVDRRDKVCFHSLRHTFASWLVESGVDLYVVKELMGHSTLSMTERYSHLSNGALQEAVRKLDNSMQAIEVIQDIRAAK